MDARSTRIAHWFEWPTLFAAALAIPDIIFLQARADEPFYTIAVVVYWATWLLFVAELAIMMAVVPNRWQWLRRHPIELIVIFLTRRSFRRPQNTFACGVGFLAVLTGYLAERFVVRDVEADKQAESIS